MSCELPSVGTSWKPESMGNLFVRMDLKREEDRSYTKWKQLEKDAHTQHIDSI